MFTAQQAEEKFGPDLEFRLSHRALAKKAKREATAAAAAQAAAARLREEELGGVVDPRRPKKQKTIARDATATALPEAEKKGAKSKNGRGAMQRDGDDDAEDTPPAVVKKDKKVKGKSAAECEAPRCYPDSAAWGGEQGVVLDGRIAAAISDMVCDFAVASPALAANIAAIYLSFVVSYSPRRPSRPPCPSRAPSSPAPYATASTSSVVQRRAAARRWRMPCL